MEKEYNDNLMPQNFEEIAKAYSQSLKKRGFIFVRLEEEEFNLLLDEIFVILQKIKACLTKLSTKANSSVLRSKIERAEILLKEKFGSKNIFEFKYTGNNNNSFLCLIGLENLLVVKLLLLAVKSEEFELCCKIISSVCNVFYQSFNFEDFCYE